MAYLLWHYLRDSAARFPDRPAVQWGDRLLTYAELDQASTRLAALLAGEGIGPGSRVAFYMPKTDRSVVAMQGALKAGATYVPIDPGAPPLRAGFILRDCAVRALITTRPRLEALEEAVADLRDLRLVLLADESPAGAGRLAPARAWREIEGYDASRTAEDLAIEHDPAYLLYTSGSTGSPKGVILTHRNAMTFVDWAGDEFGIAPGDRLSNHAPLHFDLSVFDVYAALRAGACVLPVPDQVSLFPKEQARWIEAERITTWYSVPSALTRLLLHGQMERFTYAALRTVLFAGEVFPVKYLRQVMNRMPGAAFANLYGPTETNVCTFYRVPRPLPGEVTDIPIGHACANTEVFALDDQGRVAAVGEEGELWVRGPSVMPGYWGLPEKSASVRQPNPLQPAFDETAYRTGDLVRLRPDGEYTFVGRRDHMVKSRGYRIELGEIEQVLYAHERIREAVVVPVPDDQVGARLHALLSEHPGDRPSDADLRAFCLARLPAYMVPESFSYRPELPKTSTGKIDRQALARELAPTPKEGEQP